MKKGFTLVELLGTIVLISILAVITIPVVTKIVDYVRKEAVKNSVYSLFKSAYIYYAENEIENKNDKIIFTCDGNKCMTAKGGRLSFKGSAPTGGQIITDVDGKAEAYYLRIGEWCILGTKSYLDINKDCTKLDATSAEVTLKQVAVTSKSITVQVNATDNESSIKKIIYDFDGKTYEEDYNNGVVNTTRSFSNLKAGQEYNIKVKVINGNDLEQNEQINISTLDLGTLIVKFNNTPATSQNGYLKSQTAYLDYSSNDAEGYYIKSLRDAKSDINSKKVCTGDTVPDECTNSETLNIEANKWYYFEDSPNLTYNETNSTDAVLYARVTNGISITSNSSGTISKIDQDKPILELDTSTATSKNIIIPFTTTDEHSGLNTQTCKYSTTDGSYTSSATVEDSTCLINNVNHNTTYYYQICSTDLVGNKKCETGSNKTLKLSVTLKSTNTPSNAQNEYLKTQVWNLDTTGSPTGYYIKSTRAATSSVNLTKSCGSDTDPTTCTDITSTKNMDANIWYYTESKPSITYDKTATQTDTLLARITDGKNTTVNASATVSKIDITSPTVTLGTATVTSNSVSIPITSSDAHSGLNTVTCKYSTTSGSYTEDASSATTSNCLISNAGSNSTYYYQVCINDLVGNESTCKTGSAKTTQLSVTLKSTNTPTTAVNGYLTKQVWNLTTTGNPTGYWIKSTRAATSSVNLTQSCGTDDSPGTCTTITATKSMTANTWYYTTSKPSITYSSTSTTTATLYAKITDGYNTTLYNSATVSKIENCSYSANKQWSYGYKGNYQTFTTPCTGNYKIELWGAQGGNTTATGGKGAYTSGTITLTHSQKLYVYVGGAGSSTEAGVQQTISGGYNGGGSTGGQDCCNRKFGSGGGATDIRITSGTWNNATSLASRIMVAAGGGGSYSGTNDVEAANNGGAGGTLIGKNGTQSGGTEHTYCYGLGGTQLAGGLVTTDCYYKASFTSVKLSSFGKGGGDTGARTGGGGGYYGGSSSGHIASAGGGSSYISGHKGSIAITSASNLSPRKNSSNATCASGTTDITCSYHYSNNIFKSTSMIDGNSSMPNKSGSGNTTGNTGNGYAKITYLGFN
ncbi:MAG: prepilin-type N-terminal cleavage/methylation domain-containing protein [Bacilli bacterium]|nr:prepilin-type N-terminal cleavage/methylation domain-containing protein [Bacilli bacterium]